MKTVYKSLKLGVFLFFLVFFIYVSSLPSLAVQDTGNENGRLRVQIVSLRQTTISAEIPARISELSLLEGDSFKEGRVLVCFDCSLLEAQLNKAEATAEAARRTFQVNKRLFELDAMGSLEVAQSEAKVRETEAEVTATKVMVSKCSIKAPFAGRVAKLHAEAHQYTTTGKPIMDILDTDNLEVRLVVPSKWLQWLKAGTKFQVKIDELNKGFTANVTRIGARIDALSQSVTLAAQIDGPHKELLPGMSGWAEFKTRK